MRKNIAKVIEAFRLGKACVGDSKRTCRTDGTTVWSYDMPVAARVGKVESFWSVRLINTSAAPTATTRSQVQALAATFPNAERVDFLCPFYEFQKLPRRP